MMTEQPNQQPNIQASEKNKPKGKMTQFISDYVPLIIFFVSYRFYDIFIATASLIVTSTLAVIYIYATERRFAMLPTVTAGLVLVFGTATLLLQDENLIKLKSTIIQLLFAVIL
ncbi:MAG: septation protein IspZ, partial [Alphaproteobacteria bacterium]|nr:septation protein IspZ [Alphaproteobacteria bacterium]